MASGNGEVSSVDPTSYLTLVRRLNLMRQIVEFRTERNWTDSAGSLERTRQFFVARGAISYSPKRPLVLSRSGDEPLKAVSVFFGPPGSDQLVVFARRQSALNYTLIHVMGGQIKEGSMFAWVATDKIISPTKANREMPGMTVARSSSLTMDTRIPSIKTAIRLQGIKARTMRYIRFIPQGRCPNFRGRRI